MILTIFSFGLLLNFFAIKYLSNFYALDFPNYRKKHANPTPLIGGIIFSLLSLIVIITFVDKVPNWFIYGGLVSILLGAIDDNFNISWLVKLFVQLVLAIYLTYLFWGKFSHLSFYGYEIAVSQPILLILFLFWFIGIYNAVNLIDGLDGLASGFMIIICLSSIFIGQGDFSQINIYLSIILLVFLIFNQRPSKSFMGDAGSLFLGFFTAIQILLYQELYIPENSVLNITPFSIIIAFLVADTTRVFFTRILSGNNPMSADTIHLHHLVIQRSGSYLTTLFVIFFTVMTLCVFAILSIHNNYHQIGLIIHISLLLLFILTPPAPTYVELISKLIEPSYSWQKKSKIYSPKLPRTVLVSFLYIVLLFLIFSHISFEKLFHWHFLLSSILLIIFLYLSRTEKVALISLQSYQTIFLINYLWLTPINIQTKLFSVLLFISFIVFSLQRVSGTEIYKYSALDLLMLCFTVGGMILSIAGLSINVWLMFTVFVLWFGMGFIFRRTII